MYTRMCRCKEKCITFYLIITLWRFINYFIETYFSRELAHLFFSLFNVFFIYDHGQNMYCEHGLARDWLIFGVCVLVQKNQFLAWSLIWVYILIQCIVDRFVLNT